MVMARDSSTIVMRPGWDGDSSNVVAQVAAVQRRFALFALR